MFLVPDKEAIPGSSAALPSPLPDRAKYGGVGAEGQEEEEEEEDFLDPEQSDRLSFLGCVEEREPDSPGPSPSMADEALKTCTSPRRVCVCAFGPCVCGCFVVGGGVRSRTWCLAWETF